ncbi:MAG: hypothetical protein GTN81_07115 [Proteobacteria bacterium]|nr:hypothetical protein [Pseudomonadota bacterium]
MRGRVGVCVLASMMIVGASSLCYGVEFFGRQSTQVAWWKDLIDRDTKFSAYQYLRVGALDLVKDRNISVYGYGRYGYNEVADDEEESADGRLYYLYMDWKDLWKDRMDLRLGRQWTNLVAASSIIDGAQVDFKSVGPVGVVLLGGRDVIFDEFEELTESGDIAWGGEVYLRNATNLNLSASYAEKYDEHDLARRTVAYNFGYNLKEKYRAYSDGRYDIIGQRLSEVVAGIKYFPNDTWTIRGEYFFTYPTFDATSIFAVFAASRFHAGSIYADYYVSDRLSFYGGYTAEYFEIDDADDDDAHLFEGGTHVKVAEARLKGAIVVREGYPGDLIGFSFAVSDYPFMDKKLETAAGIDYDIFQRDEMTDDEIATKYWGGVRYHFSKKISLAVHIQNTESPSQANNFAGWASVEAVF